MLWSSKRTDDPPRRLGYGYHGCFEASNGEGRRNDDARMPNLCESAELVSAFCVLRVLRGEIRGYFGEAAENIHASSHTARKLCAPQIRAIRVMRGCLFLLLFVSIRVHSWLALRKFSLNPVEGIKYKRAQCAPAFAQALRRARPVGVNKTARKNK